MKKTLYILIVITIIFSSCSKETNVILNFKHTVAEDKLILHPFGCLIGEDCIDDHICCNEGLNYTNAASEKYNIQTLKYIISNIFLHDENENSILLNDIHYIDVENESTLQFNLGEISNGNYTSLSFTMGLEDNMNTQEEYINESWHLTMAWPDMMGGGYHYMKLEGDFDTITKGYATHTGALQMMGDPIRMDHSFSVNLPISLDISDNLGDISIEINMNINNWYENPHTYNLSPSIMSDMSKQAILQANGMTDVFSVAIN